MGLNRLENFLQNVRGETLYVDQNSLDATDSIENRGNSQFRPFISVQRALLESVRFSYQSGFSNDRFAKISIRIASGEYFIDNRPGLIPDVGAATFKNRAGRAIDFSEFTSSTNFDLNSPTNDLYKLNSIRGGVILPRGVSLIGEDYRKVKIRPLYVPDPENDSIEDCAIFQLTGACFVREMSFFDANPNGFAYKDYSTNTFSPSFSHHKLKVFEYADGVNLVSTELNKTDLECYYIKAGIAFGPTSGREIKPDYPNTIDIEPVIGEYEIVGSRGREVGITSMFADSTRTLITATLSEDLKNINVDTPIEITGVITPNYNGNYIVSYKNGTQIQFKTSFLSQTDNQYPVFTSARLNLVVDTVKSASPYVRDVALLSVYGMCGIHIDGSRADGFKSTVIAEFTGISLQKDDNAFVKYNRLSGTYDDKTAVSSIHSDSKARYKPSYENYHVKCSNGAFAQLVSVYAIGYSNQFVSDSGSDESITSSSSNFGSRALYSSGFKADSFPKDDTGYITHIIPPKEIEINEVTIEFDSIDVLITTQVANAQRLYLYNQTNQSIPPDSVIEGYRIGAKINDTLNVSIGQATYSAQIAMSSLNESSKKTYSVSSISNSTVTFTSNHNLQIGESIRILGDSGEIPDGLNSNQVYYAYPVTGQPNQIKIAGTLNEALSGSTITINNRGSNLTVESRVSDKRSGDIGHPIQYDTSRKNWYIQVSTSGIYSQLSGLTSRATSRTYIKRSVDSRNLEDRLYKVRYSIPKNSSIVARPPMEGYVIQESNTTLGANNLEIEKYLNSGSTISSVNEFRNYKILSFASWVGSIATFTSETSHRLNVGDEIEIYNVKSSNNTTAKFNSGYNQKFIVKNILNSTQFQVDLSSNPGTFQNDISIRTTSLPYLKRKKYITNFVVYKVEEIQEYIPNQKDGVYHLTLINSSNSPKISPFQNLKFNQPILNLYPQFNRDNPNSDPIPSKCHASSEFLGNVYINSPENSLTKETAIKFLSNNDVGIAITNISSSSATQHTVYTKYDHGLNPITSVTIQNGGNGYGDGTDKLYYGAKLIPTSTGIDRGVTASVNVNSGGSVTAVKIVNGGSAFTLASNTFNVVGIASTTVGFTPAVVQLQSINNHLGESISIQGITGPYSNYNEVYRLSTINNSKELVLTSSKNLGVTTSSLGLEQSSNSFLTLNGKTLTINSPISYNKTTGVGIITTLSVHSLLVGNKIVLGNYTNSFFNREVVVQSKIDDFTFTANFGPSSTDQIADSTSTKRIFRTFLNSNGGTNNQNTEGRLITIYDELSNIVSNLSPVDAETDTINIPDSTFSNLNVGDYLIIDNEIVRIYQLVQNNTTIKVLRGLFGTIRSSHNANTVIQKIRILPVELRRNSIMRVSSHTFEYVGYGPGNYSTTLPERQDRQLSPAEQINSQSLRAQGGVVIFDAINSEGDTYTINTKINSSTGRAELYNAPIPTTTGEDLTGSGTDVGYDVSNPLEINVSRSITVEGGSNSDIISRFNGPVIFNNKIVSNSIKGIEANSLYLQGEALISKKYTVGISTPSLVGNIGDVVFRESPQSGGSLGWVYSTSSKWEEFGLIQSNNTWTGTFSGTFIGDIAGVNVPNYWTVTSTGLSTTRNVTIGSATPNDSYKFYVNGSVGIQNGLNVTENSTFNQSVYISNDLSIGNNFQLNGNYITFAAGAIQNNAPIGYIQYTRNGVYQGSINAIYNGSGINYSFITGVGQEPLKITSSQVIVAGSLVSNSDIKLKKNIQPIQNSLNQICNLNGVEYDRIDTNSHQYGLIANEVEKIVPQLVSGTDTKSVSYIEIIPILIEAIKELKSEIEELKKHK